MSKHKVFSLEDKANIIGNIEPGLTQADVDQKYDFKKINCY